jgi:D-3-phosphoglycerate dehydrogenase / 2-oxoglutarate reductase
MVDTVDSLLLDLLEWVGDGARPYLEVLDAWRTSCPRLPVWEESRARGFVELHNEPGRGRFVSVSDAGLAHLRSHLRHDARVGG